MTEEELKDQEIEAGTEAAEGAVSPEGEAGATPADETESAGVVDLESKLVSLEEKLAQAEKLAAEYLDGWQRAQASFVNFRKRTESEQAQAQSRANARLLARIVPVMDDFKRAFDAIPEADKANPWLEGIRLVQRKLKAVLESENVKPIEVKPGDGFDPNIHEAVLYQEVEGFDEGEIVAEIETGYTLADRVLRPTLVVVAKGRTPEALPEEPASEDAATLGDTGD